MNAPLPAEAPTDFAPPPPARGTRVFTWPVRVYWEDTDAGGIVFYANYLKFLERARTEWLRHEGIGQQRLREEAGVLFVVTDTALRYRRPARLDDRLLVTVDVLHAGRASLQIAQAAWCDGTLAVEGEIRIGCLDARTMQPARLPDAVAQRLARTLPAIAARRNDTAPRTPPPEAAA